MDSNKYDSLAQELEKLLNQKGTLIRFHVPGALEYSLNRGFHNNQPPTHFRVDWIIKIERKQLIGTVTASRELITDSAVDVADVLIRDITNAIINAIISPDTVPEAKIIIT